MDCSGPTARSSATFPAAMAFASLATGVVHGEEGQNLQQMILEDIAPSPRLPPEATAPPSHAEIFRHRDLHVVDVIPVPDRL